MLTAIALGAICLRAEITLEANSLMNCHVAFQARCSFELSVTNSALELGIGRTVIEFHVALQIMRLDHLLAHGTLDNGYLLYVNFLLVRLYARKELVADIALLPRRTSILTILDMGIQCQ